MNDRNDWFLLALVFVVAPAAYILWLAFPLFVFYLIPFVGSALLASMLWLIGCEHSPVNYRRVAGFMAGTILFLLATVGFPKPVLMSRGKLIIESHRLFNAFNRANAEVQGVITSSPLKYFRPMFGQLIPPADYRPVLYDRRDLSWTLWLGVCFGAPALFLWRGKREDQEQIVRLTADCNAKVETANQERSETERELRIANNWAAEMIKIRDDEIKKLQAVVDSVKKDLPPPAPTESAGSGVPESPREEIFGPNGV